MKPAFVVDLNRCTGCQACIVACWMENRDHQRLPWRQVHTYNAFHHPLHPTFHLSLACHHCEHPACLAQCPARAYSRVEATGAVLMDPARCMGCRYCTWACPHDAPKFEPRARVIEKCTFCQARLQEGLEPACVARCPVEALALDPDRSLLSEASVSGFPASALEPGIRFVPLRRAEPPEASQVAPAASLSRFLDGLLPAPPAKITLRGEWTLVLFTTVLSLLAAWQAASLFGGPPSRPWVQVLLGAVAMGLSTWHLGHPERAWRALLNVRHSWLSREIALVSLFLGLIAMQALGGLEPRTLGWAATLTGFAALFAVDRIYRVALRTGPWDLHSAHVLLNALYLFGWLSPFRSVAVVAGAVKLLLYGHRTWHAHRHGRPPRMAWSLARILTGFLAPWFLPGHLAAASALSGDLLDRCEYYDELDIPSPANQMVREMRKQMGL